MFIRLTYPYTEASILVNLDHIESIYSDPNGRCALVTSRGADTFLVKETFEQVSSLISTRIINP